MRNSSWKKERKKNPDKPEFFLLLTILSDKIKQKIQTDFLSILLLLCFRLEPWTFVFLVVELLIIHCLLLVFYSFPDFPPLIFFVWTFLCGQITREKMALFTAVKQCKNDENSSELFRN